MNAQTVLIKLNIKARTAPTTTRRPRDPRNLELTPNQLHRIIHRTPIQQLQTGLVNHNLRPIFSLKHSIVLFRLFLLEIRKVHEVLEAMASAGLNGDAESGLVFLIIDADFLETLTGAGRDGDEHWVAGLVGAGFVYWAGFGEAEGGCGEGTIRGD